MYPIEILLDEHKLVERVFAIVNKILEKLKDNKEIPATAFWKLVEFIRGYADVIHHSKEEDILFSQMQEHDEDLSTEVKDQIGVLIDEHIQGLDIANEMHKGIREYRRGHPAAREHMLSTVTDYLNLMKPHFESEEEDVFPSMVGVLSQKEKDDMKADFDRFDNLLGGAEVHKRYKQIVKDLESELD